ncbi:MAG: bL35 family ribosomal protein [Patescibacteria group bacterium]|jgi:ribosomal protein L35
MPKHKTNKSYAKRFEVTKNGKLMRYNQSDQHLTQGKSNQSLQKAGKKTTATKAQAKKIIKMI